MKQRATENTLTVEHSLRIRFSETDSLGIVWHGNYLQYFEEGRETFGRKYALSYLDIKTKGFAAPIVKTTTEHFLPLRYGDTAIVETTFIPNRAAKMVFNYVIKNKAGRRVCTGETVQVFTKTDGAGMTLALPEFFEVWKQKMGLVDA